MDNNNIIENLIYIFSKLPGLGPRSARRIVIHLLEDQTRIKNLTDSLSYAQSKITECELCYNIDSISPCNICMSENRENSVIAIVESVPDLWALERSKTFKGLYHVLGGTLSASSGKKPEDMKLSKLLQRISNSEINEIIIATNSTLDGQTTAFYITEFLKDCNIKISRLASGIPIGGELDYLDEGTLKAALMLRQPF
jgi:recombination protein RecR